ncbi:alcohol dehydrogenase catalytic domain-containing protein [Streptococcus dentiloxodontae]
MKAIQVKMAGGPEVLELVDLPKPNLKEGWSLIKIKGFGLNRSEIFTRQGFSPSVQFPRVLGIECVGIIEETTDNERLPIGQKVLSTMGEMGRAFDGSYAEYVLVPNEQIFPIQTDLAWADFAAIPESYFTAYGSMLQLKIAEKDTILVRGAASGVGLAFVNLVKSAFPNTRVYGSVRNLSKKAKLLVKGYDGIILEHHGKLETDLIFDKVLELVGPKVIKDSISHMAKGGIICNTGQLGGQWYLEDFDPIMELMNEIYLTGFYSGFVSAKKWQSLFDFIEQYQVTVTPEKVLSLEEVAAGHAYMESPNAFGKVVVLLDKD